MDGEGQKNNRKSSNLEDSRIVYSHAFNKTILYMTQTKKIMKKCGQIFNLSITPLIHTSFRI